MNIHTHLFRTFLRSAWPALGDGYAALPLLEEALTRPHAAPGEIPTTSAQICTPSGKIPTPSGENATADSKKRTAAGGAPLLTADELTDSIGVAQALPGFFLLNLSAHVGYRTAGLAGSLCAVAGALVPALFGGLLIGALLLDWREAPGLAAALRGVRPAFVALLCLATWRSARRAGLNLSNVWLPVVTLAVAGFAPAVAALAAVGGGLLYALFIHPDHQPAPQEPPATPAGKDTAPSADEHRP